jgi:cytochrome c peroxidase
MWRLVLVLGMLSGVVGCDAAEGGIPFLGPPPPPSPATLARGEDLNPRMLRRFKPLRAPEVENGDQVALGKMLYFDPRLSRKHDMSCNTCHPLDHHGTEERPTSIGAEGKHGKRNAPTVFNSASHIAQFWDGRAADLEAQAKSPILDASEMAMLEPRAVAAKLQHIPGYVTAFTAAFPGEPAAIDLAHVARAIAAFERTLVTPGRWDRFLEGDHSALSKAEQEGLKLFADIGCMQCHSGELIGGSMFQKAGVVEAWPNQADQGRYEVTHLESDRMVFKVPSLRNVALTPPYFHDGSVATLRDAIAMMGKHQLGVVLTSEEVTAIEAWLKALDGTSAPVSLPTLP